ncbi:hypothetical protein Ahy_A10g051145 [Arachis hypogaea]|uniref:Uncharacterized protein n=2 Tax=Arachis TaxID=3817 RepID=A0A445BBQ9_ARAHY|nr:hypothetical protein Ahy_A10g051145 [Arachis hypogaea]
MIRNDKNTNNGNQTEKNKREMKKGVHPQKQWISYVTQTGRLMHVMMTKIHPVGKVYHFRARRQMAESLGQIAKFRRRFGLENPETTPKK